MKKLLMAMGCIGLLMSSCTISQTYQLTGEPIGTKVGVARTKIIGNSDYSVRAAAANGKITRIGAVQITTKVYLIFPITSTYAYGE